MEPFLIGSREWLGWRFSPWGNAICFPTSGSPSVAVSAESILSIDGITLDFSELESQSEKIETAMAKTLGELEDRMEEKKAGFDLGNLSVDAEVVDESVIG